MIDLQALRIDAGPFEHVLLDLLDNRLVHRVVALCGFVIRLFFETRAPSSRSRSRQAPAVFLTGWRGHDSGDSLQAVLAKLVEAASRPSRASARSVVVLLELDVEHQLAVDVSPKSLAAHVLGKPVHFDEDLRLRWRLQTPGTCTRSEMLAYVAKVRLQDLADVHSARNAERVENDVDRGAVGKERHVLHGKNLGDDSLVAVASRHLVADHQLSLLGGVDLNRHVRAGRQLVARNLEQGLVGAVADQSLALLGFLINVVDATGSDTCSG